MGSPVDVTIFRHMFEDGRSLGALIVSALLHVAVALGVAAGSKASAQVRDDATRPDAWAGNTFEVDALLAQAAVPKAPAPVAPAPAAEAPEAAGVKEPVAVRQTPRSAARPLPPRAPAAATEPGPSEGSAKPESSSTAEPAARSARREARRPSPEEGDAGGAPAEASATYGAAGQAAMERSLAKAFTRAIPAAISRDPIWSELELGPAGSTKIEITIDEEGKIASVEPEWVPPKQLKNLLDRTQILLRSGRFALSRGEGAGTETLELEATISVRPDKVDETANPRDTVQLGFEPPSSEKAGRAFFILASGRQVEIRVKLVPQRG
jgi:outer membrane biosynthesis protein TonB